MMTSETILVNQIKNVNTFIQSIEKYKGIIILGGVHFSLESLKRIAIDMQLNAQYIAFDIEALRRENKHLRGLIDNG